jgi:hypothetical protein
MKKFFAALAGVLLANASYAADLPTKAPALNVAALSGFWYVGVGTEMGTEQASVNGNNLFATSLIGQGGSLQASGGAVTAAIGYLHADPARWYRFQATAAYQNISGADGAVATVRSPWSATQEFDIGFEWVQQILTVFPTLFTIPAFPTPGLPSNVTVVGTPKQYVGVLAKESMITGQFIGGSGSTWDWAPGVATGWIWQLTNAAGKPTGGLLDAYLNVSFPQRGFTVSFPGQPGAPTLGGAAKMGTLYTVGLRFDLPVM